MDTTAILVDGGFFKRRFKALVKKNPDPKEMADHLERMCKAHLRRNKEPVKLYRIFYYDCEPYLKKQTNPITKKTVDFSKSPEAMFQTAFLDELRKRRKFAIRLGYLSDSKSWSVQPRRLKEIFQGKISFSDLKEGDVSFSLQQKGVDIRIGTDISSLAFNKLVDQIVLISGDSDFVPAAKLARREGIDFILDPMWNHIKPDLHEHIDGLRSIVKNPDEDP